jgi:nucleoside-diphosphate-sugar epimerase
MNVLLLGGTGPMGIHLSNILSARGNEIYITSRREHDNKGNVFYIKGNARDVVFANSILRERQWDCIVDFMVYDTEEFKNRIDDLLSNTKQYVFLSSARVYDDKSDYITEDSTRLLDTSNDEEYLKTDEYALYKAREEDVLRNSKYTNYIIIRPYITYAENRLPLGVWEKETWVRRFLEGKDLALTRNFLIKDTTLCYGKDVSFCISNLIGNPSALGETYNVTSNKSCTWEDVLNIYLDEVEKLKGYRPKVTLVDAYILNYKRMLFNWFVDMLSFKLAKVNIHIVNKSYQLIYDREFNRRFDNTKLLQMVPNAKFSDCNCLLGKCFKTFSERPDYSYRNWIWEFVQDKLTGNSTALRDIPSLSLKAKYLLIRYCIPKKYIAR